MSNLSNHDDYITRAATLSTSALTSVSAVGIPPAQKEADYAGHRFNPSPLSTKEMKEVEELANLIFAYTKADDPYLADHILTTFNALDTKESAPAAVNHMIAPPSEKLTPAIKQEKEALKGVLSGPSAPKEAQAKQQKKKIEKTANQQKAVPSKASKASAPKEAQAKQQEKKIEKTTNQQKDVPIVPVK